MKKKLAVFTKIKNKIKRRVRKTPIKNFISQYATSHLSHISSNIHNLLDCLFLSEKFAFKIHNMKGFTFLTVSFFIINQERLYILKSVKTIRNKIFKLYSKFW